MKINPILAKDFYKVGHILQYPTGTTKVYSNFTPRSSEHALNTDKDSKLLFFGLQGVIQWLLIDLWNAEFFDQPKKKVIAQYKRRVDNALGVGAITTGHIEALHDLGYLPIHIKALPEGSRVGMRIPVFTVTNTLPEFYWLTNMLETSISAECWKSSTTATTAKAYREMLEEAAKLTGAPLDFVPLQGHDFSMRGMSGIYDAAQSSAGHLLSFVGTDTIPAIDYLENYYMADSSKELVGCSVPATEHSVMCMGGQTSELKTFERLITEVYPSGIISIVSDTWDFWEVITSFAHTLKEQILSRTPNGLGLAKVVFRPDSGDPVKIICGDPEAQKGSPEYKGAVECLWDIFGGTKTEKGYKILHERVGLIYGDSITLERGRDILRNLEKKGFASCNIVLGIGSFTYQYVTRDSYGFAMKATYGEIEGRAVEIFKNPVTDSGTKKSAKGLLRVERQDGAFVLYDQQSKEQEVGGLLKTVFHNGKVANLQSLADIRKLVAE